MARIVIDARKLGDLGIGTYIEGIVRELMRFERRHEYDLLLPPGSKLTGADNFRFLPFGSPKYSARELWALPWKLHELRADLLHSPHYVVPPLRPCRAVVTIHDLIHLKFPELLATPLHRYYAWTMLFLATRTARRILTVSEHTKLDLVRMLRVAPERILVAPNGLGDGFRPVEDPAPLERVRQAYRLPRRFALCVGNINPHKNVPRLLEAFARMSSQEPDLWLVLIGESQRRDAKVEAIRAALRGAGRVLHISYVPHEELPVFYTLAEFFVTPSLYEGFGLTPLEAMACGAPVAAARRASLPEVIGEAAGLWFDPEKVQDMADALSRLAADSSLRERLRGLGLARAREFSWRRAAELTFKAYEEALQT